MRLWSVVVIQLVQPRGSGRTSWATSWGIARRAVVGAVSVAAMEEGLGVGLGVALQLQSAGRRGGVRFLDLRLLAGQVALELRRGHGVHVGEHVRVVAPAQLRALAAEV